MWWLYLIIILLFIKIYNKLVCGRCYSRSIMTGKVVIVTGANSGIGYGTAFNLARRGAKVILACRDELNGKAAAKEISSKTNNSSVIYMNLDLTSFESIRRFVKEFIAKEKKLDVLINNAGMSGLRQDIRTKDGLLTEMQTNHFGPFLLTVLLVPILKNTEGSRVVIVSSVAHKLITSTDIYSYNDATPSSLLKPFHKYSKTKLCNILFSNELARRLEPFDVAVNCLHPGHVRTSIYKNVGGIVEIVANFVLSVFFKNATEGAQTVIYLAVADEVINVTGKYFVDCKEGTISKAAQDKELASKLWMLSEELVKLRPEEKIL